MTGYGMNSAYKCTLDKDAICYAPNGVCTACPNKKALTNIAAVKGTNAAYAYCSQECRDINCA